MAKSGFPISLPAFDWKGDWRTSAHEQAYQRLVAADAAARDKGEIKGRLLRFPAADSYAVYQITGVRPLTLSHVDYMDGWTISAAHLRGITLAEVKEELRREDALAAFFARKKAEQEASA